MVIDEGRDTAVRVVLGVLRALLLALGKVEVDGLIREAELFEHNRDFPADTKSNYQKKGRGAQFS